MVQKRRTDADRRVRQCERLGRLLRLLHLISGKGRWDAGTLAQELECSRRTVYRLLQTLSMAGVPWYFDENVRAYRVRPGFKFPILDENHSPGRSPSQIENQIEPALERVIADGESFIRSLKSLLDSLRKTPNER